jgi:hypothetical protein
MSDVEHRVRDLLERHATDAPAGATLLTAVRAESRRRTRRTRVLLAAVVTVLAGLGAALPLRLATAPLSVAAPSTLTEPSAPATVTFPLSLPADMAPPVDPSEVRLAAGLPTLSQQLPGPTAATALLTVSPTRPPVLAAATGTEPVAIRGRTGLAVEWLAAGGPSELSLVWQEGPEQWFELRAFPRVPVGQLAGFAKSLVPVPVTAPAPFTFAVVPTGYTIDNISPAAVTFCPPDVTFDQSFEGKITVMLGVAGERSAGRQVDVAGHSGTLTEPVDGYLTLQVDLGDGRLLVVQSGVRVPLPEADLIRFAAGITVTPSATPGQG